jgi:hypothetical protein
MIVTDWSDASLAVANDDGRVAAERALATACARTPSQAKERRRLVGHASLATHGFIRSYECAKWVAVFASPLNLIWKGSCQEALLEIFGPWISLSEDESHGTADELDVARRWIRLIFAGLDRMTLIRLGATSV